MRNSDFNPYAFKYEDSAYPSELKELAADTASWLVSASEFAISSVKRLTKRRIQPDYSNVIWVDFENKRRRPPQR